LHRDILRDFFDKINIKTGEIMREKSWFKGLLAGLLLAGASCAGMAEEGFKSPELRIPKLKKVPVIDGKITPGEWKDCAAVTAFASGGPGSTVSIVPEMQQVVWYIGYDDKYLYLAMRSPQPEGTYPKARVKGNDDLGVLFEDHVEVQLFTHVKDRSLATFQGKGFYKMMVNPKAAMIDQYLWNGTIGTEELWSTGGPVKCDVTPKHWDLEMAIEIKRLKLDKLDGKSLVMQLVRTDFCGGIYFAGWVSGCWLEWKRFTEVFFDSNVPVFQFLQAGELGAGDVDSKFRLLNQTDKEQKVKIEVSLDNAEGKVIYRESKEIALQAGQTQDVDFKKSGLKLSKVQLTDPQRNHFEVKATMKDGTKTVVLYHNRLPLMQFDEEVKNTYIDPWVKGRPQSGEWEYKFAYLPYANKAEAKVDLDFFGVPKKITTAKSYQVKIKNKADGKVLGQGGGKVDKLVGDSCLIDLPGLKTGEYQAVFSLLDGDKKVISEKTVDFKRAAMEWEHNKVGIDNEVIPPFFPIDSKSPDRLKVWTGKYLLGGLRKLAGKDSKIFRVWGRNYCVNGTGLLNQIFAAQPTGTGGDAVALLAKPMTLKLKSGGKDYSDQPDGTLKIEEAPDKVELKGESSLGPVKAKVTSVLEYDGWYEVEMELEAAGGVTVDSLALEIELLDKKDNPVDTIYVQRMGDGRYGNHFEGLSRKAGVCFESSKLLEYKRDPHFDWKSFVPRTYVGNGDCGLWFFAWSAAGWELSNKNSMMKVDRLKNGNVKMQVNLLAEPVKLDKLRKLRFAIQAAPVKPNHQRYRTVKEEGRYVHDTRGYRYFGDSVDSYSQEGKDNYGRLRKFMLYGPNFDPSIERSSVRHWTDTFRRKIADGAGIIMYGSGRMTGIGNKAFRLFGGEWLQDTNWKPRRDAANFAGKWNYQATVKWESDAQLTAISMNWTDSHTDFFVWWHNELIKKAGFNGTWWDNTSMFNVWQYNPELGRMESIWGLYARRKLCKRLNIMAWKAMRPPFWAMNMHVDMSWNQVFWMVENDWYADAPNVTTLEQWGVDQFRSMTRTKSTTLIAQPWLSGFKGTTPEKDYQVKRSLQGMLMSHDIHSAPNYDTRKMSRSYQEALLRMRSLLDLANTTMCKFYGYWKTGEMVKPSDEKITAAVYNNSKLKTAVVILFNTAKNDKYLAGTTFDINKLIPVSGKLLNLKRVYDLESNKDISVDFEDGLFKLKEQMPVSGYNFRMLAVEAE
jgi:hypothetical protein